METPLTPQQLRKAFAIAFNQYATVDFRKCEHADTIVLGYFRYGLDQRHYARPFMFTNEKERLEVEEEITQTECDYIAFSFVQHYIHYT